MTAHLLVAHPSADVYGSDLQLVETVRAVVPHGWRVTVHLPERGPLVPLLEEAGAAVRVTPTPVLRKAFMSPVGLVRLAAQTLGALPRMVRTVRRASADVVLVNTLTIPAWLVAARLARSRVLCHVHEAEADQPLPVRVALAAPLLLAHRVVVNSAAAAAALVEPVRALRSRVAVIHNGVDGPPVPPARARVRTVADPLSIALVARLSPRKGVDVALEAVALLRQAGRPVSLTVCGTTFPGYEWFDADLRARTHEEDLEGAVTFLGYVKPTWEVLSDADVVLVPSRAEPFGNTAVEALLARRPLVASSVQGLAEIVVDGENGLQVPPGDPDALAAAIARIADDPDLAARLADDGRHDALARFSLERYRTLIRTEAEALRRR